MVAEEHEPKTATPFNDFSRHRPTEDFVTIDRLLKSHAAQSQQEPLICYPANGVSDFEEHTAADIDKYTDLAVQFYVKHGIEPAVSLTLEKIGFDHCD